jgi:hypothetical protein
MRLGAVTESGAFMSWGHGRCEKRLPRWYAHSLSSILRGIWQSEVATSQGPAGNAVRIGRIEHCM